MKYKVKTVLISNFDMGESISEGVYKNLCIAGCPKEWFEKIEPEVKEGQYWKWGKGVYRVGDVHSKRECFIKNIREDDEFSIPIEILKRDGSKLSNKEVEQALKQEINRRGYHEGTKIEPLDKANIITLPTGFIDDYKNDCLTVDGWLVYCEGDFAEITEDEWEVKEVEGYLFVNGPDVEIGMHGMRGFKREEAETVKNALNNLNNGS